MNRLSKVWMPLVAMILLSTLTRNALASSKPADTTPLVIGQSFALESAVLQETRRINVYLPAGFAESTTARVPVLYMPDGGLAEDFLHIAGLMQVSMANGSMRPFLLVGIENTQRRRDLTPPTQVEADKKIAPVVGGAAAFRAFLKTELIPEVERRYRTTSERAIIGESLAGLFILDTFFAEPDLFQHHIAIDPSLWWDNQALLKRSKAELIKRGAKPSSLFVANSSEPTIAPLAKKLAANLKRVKSGSLHWQHLNMPEETHLTIFHPAATRAVRSVLAWPPEDPTTKSDEKKIEPSSSTRCP